MGIYNLRILPPKVYSATMILCSKYQDGGLYVTDFDRESMVKNKLGLNSGPKRAFRHY